MRFERHFFAVCAALIFFGGSASATPILSTAVLPPLVGHATKPEKFVPAGWSVWQIRRGDLNNDGIADAVMIMEQGKDPGIYRLVVVVADPSGGFDLVADNGKLLSNGRDTEEYHYVLDAARFRIHHGTFSVETVRCCLGGSASTTMTFQLRNDRFALIGYDYLGDHRGQVKLSFNMLSGRVLATQSDDDPASDFYGRRERKEGRFLLPSPIYLDAMTSPDEFDASKYSPLN